MQWPERPGPARRFWRRVERRRLAASGAYDLDSWDRVGRVLGQPQSVLCLGNGPSSEDPALPSQTFDCVFRVNWVWQARATLAQPRVIFTADNDVPRVAPDAIIAFPTRSDANEILDLYRRAAVMPRNGYVVMEELPSPLSASTWPLRPTNGAMMIAAAVQLQPARLTIAGVDLYRHPAGRYPGATAEANDYDSIHSRDNDLDAIRLALAEFKGEVTIIGDQLRAAMA